MTQPVRLAINGASGRMGRALLALVRDDRRFELVHAGVSAGSEHDGKPVFGELSTSIRYGHDWQSARNADVVIDFSGPEGLAAALTHCMEHGAALVTGTTGIDASLQERVVAAASTIAVLHAANFSLGVAVLTRLLREAAAALPDWDLEIIESHHSRKEDAPSGTALALGHAAAQARWNTQEKECVLAPDGRPGARWRRCGRARGVAARSRRARGIESSRHGSLDFCAGCPGGRRMAGWSSTRRLQHRSNVAVASGENNRISHR